MEIEESEPADIVPADPLATVDDDQPAPRREYDLLALLALAVLPDIANCFLYSDSAWAGEYSVVDFTLQLIVRSIQVSVPLLVIMRLMRVDWAEYGFRPYRLARDTAVAFGLIVLSYFMAGVAAGLLTALGFDLHGVGEAVEHVSSESTSPLLALTLVLISSLANGFAEELAMRSFLITRLRSLGVPTEGAVLGSSCLFAAYHAYQGTYGMVSVLGVGLVFGAYFAWARRLWPVVTAHFLMDVIAMVYYLDLSGG
ncbi:CAAX amino terminal protease self- immunity [Posidoniimonas corsicana]|uniref:CAAX amino terminal protease self-immunity n=1 Tax=Posidoniimonas corsicana TaxID=1938618 RepID=A0A5C5UT07_9BACT|nr:CPBP family intramembrane glutamic endopeptidase [Posidoniimonas corsicana]TWT29218.1 CAAX amino terminal protease self- immunity [Posidoniimonas corsicana]